MKTFVFALFILFLIPDFAFPQPGILNRRVKIDRKEGTLGIILSEISANGGFIFTYGQDIPQDNYVTLMNSKQTVGEFLEELFGEEIYCVEYGNKLIIKQKTRLPRYYSIQGKVLDAETKEPIPGVTVFIPDSKPLIGSVSDQEGHFQIDVPSDRAIIQLSCIGYESNSISPTQTIHEEIELNPENQELSEVRIVYYEKPGTTELNGAVSAISKEKFGNTPLNNIEHALQGNSTGVHVVRNSGMPGSSLQVKIRGINSLINSEPVYYLDEIPIQQTSVNALSPHDIEFIEILKDASGTARYGASAGNGVVLLHSRKGNSKKTTVTLDYYYGHQQVWKTLDLMTSKEFLEFFEKVRPEDPRFDDLDTIYQTNWMELAFHSAKTEDYHFSVSGGNKISTFYLSSGYFTQASIIKELELTRYSCKINSEHLIGKRIQLGQDISIAYLNYKGLKEGCFLNDFSNPILGSMLQLPLSPPNDIKPIQISPEVSITSPNDDLILTNNSRKNYSLFGTIYSTIDLLPSVQYSVKLGFEVYHQDNLNFNRPQPATTLNSTDLIRGNEINIQDLSFDWQHSIMYSPKIFRDHSLAMRLEYELGQSRNEWIPIMSRLYDQSMNTVPDTSFLTNESYAELRTTTKFSHYAYSGSIQYAFRNRYHIGLSLRRDIVGFYFDHELKKLSGLYPSFSLGWVFTEEDFFPRSEILHYGKIRYGWGKAGNSPRLNYTFYAKMIRDMEYIYAFNTSRGSTNSAYQRQTNEKFYWEIMKSHNLGLDLGLFQNRLFLSVDYFNSHTNMGDTYSADNPIEFIQILNQRQFYGIEYLPVAEIRNRGFEYNLGYKQTLHKLSWDLTFNFTHLKNEIIDMDEEALLSIGCDNTLDPISINLPGEPARSFYGYRINGLFQEEDCQGTNPRVTNQPYTIDENGNIRYAQPLARAGDYRFIDINNDSVIDKNDKTIIGNPFPKFTYGISFNFQYLNFDVFLFFQGIYGNDIFNATKLWLYNPYGLSNWTRDIANSYRKPVYSPTGELLDEGLTDTDLHRFDYLDENKNLRVSDFYIEDGSYLRLKNIQIGYTFNPQRTIKVYIQKFRIYIAALNLLTFTNYSGLDPEVGGWGIDCGIYPQPRVYMAGLNLEF